MNVVVCIKQVPDPEIPPAQFKVDEVARAVVPPPSVAPVMNGYDAHALEAALRLKERHGGTVTALSLGPPSAREVLKRALAMGADRACHVDDPVLYDADSWLAAAALARAIYRIGGESGRSGQNGQYGYDLILCGRQASDTDAGQVGLGIAAFLSLPALSPVQQVEVIENGRLRVERLTEEGYQVIDVRLPALLAVSSEIGEPRYPPLRGIMAASRAQIPMWTAADLPPLGRKDDGDWPPLARKLRLQRLYQERREAACEHVQGESPADAGRALADRLRQVGVI
ncbi:MAG: electron transfer flavoprotein subunit beta/FixA family protein [Chloroflexi bacterium]|nr:electron transfer flavoprotein subunit beta/FixA family protein [Chloroflexota bacterium]